MTAITEPTHAGARVITAAMPVDDGEALEAAALVAPRVAGTLAFLLKADLDSGDIDGAAVLAATELVFPAIAVTDVADGKARGAHVVLGDGGRVPDAIDLACCGVVVEVAGRLAATGAGAAALGHPARAVARLAGVLAGQGLPLRAGQVVLAGELTAPVPVAAGDVVRVTVGGLGSAGLRFA
jgi:2-oxopent-4-enoate/cis-2-oxohex-4-enoate hydratase